MGGLTEEWMDLYLKQADRASKKYIFYEKNCYSSNFFLNSESKTKEKKNLSTCFKPADLKCEKTESGAPFLSEPQALFRINANPHPSYIITHKISRKKMSSYSHPVV